MDGRVDVTEPAQRGRGLMCCEIETSKNEEQSRGKRVVLRCSTQELRIHSHRSDALQRMPLRSHIPGVAPKAQDRRKKEASCNSWITTTCQRSISVTHDACSNSCKQLSRQKSKSACLVSHVNNFLLICIFIQCSVCNHTVLLYLPGWPILLLKRMPMYKLRRMLTLAW